MRDIGFKAVPVQRIGLQSSAMRKLVPARELVHACLELIEPPQREGNGPVQPAKCRLVVENRGMVPARGTVRIRIDRTGGSVAECGRNRRMGGRVTDCEWAWSGDFRLASGKTRKWNLMVQPGGIVPTFTVGVNILGEEYLRHQLALPVQRRLSGLPRLPAGVSGDQARERLLKGGPVGVVLIGSEVVARIRVGLGADVVAIHADVRDGKVEQVKPEWKGSTLECFTAAMDNDSISQIYLVPSDDVHPAYAAVAHGENIERAADILMQSRRVKDGYELTALIPMAHTAAKPGRSFRMEFQVSSAAGKKGGRQYGTLFGSARACRNPATYAVIQLRK